MPYSTKIQNTAPSLKEISSDEFYLSLGREVRREIVDIVAHAKRGHLASAFSLVEILNVLYESVLRVRPTHPEWPMRDRLILSKGHGCLALYPILQRLGFFSKDELYKFCKFYGILGGHPEHRMIPGVEASTGALGHGLSLGIGMALGGRLNKQAYRVFVILGDGECDEGTIWEGALSAAKHRLDTLTILVDYNKYQSYGRIEEVLNLEPFTEKWRAFGAAVKEWDAAHPVQLAELLTSLPFCSGKPNVVICHTKKGQGVHFMENNMKWHHKSKLSEEEITALKDALSDSK